MILRILNHILSITSKCSKRENDKQIIENRKLIIDNSSEKTDEQ